MKRIFVLSLLLVFAVLSCRKDPDGPQVPDPGPDPEEQTLPAEPEGRYRIYVLDRTLWPAFYLYMYGDVNGLVGSWPGPSATGTMQVGDYEYLYFDFEESLLKGKKEYLQFNSDNAVAHHEKSRRPYVEFGARKVFWYLVEAEASSVIEDPFDPGVSPEVPTPDPDPDPDPEEENYANLVDWASAMSYVYDIEAIPEIHVSVTQSDWNTLLAAYDQNSSTQAYISCDVRYVKGSETTTVPGAGLRLKGNTSRRRPEQWGNFQHCHYGINFKKYTKDIDHSVHGIRRMDLKWFKDDPMYVREIFCYDLFHRLGVWTAPYDTYCRLWMRVGSRNEAYLGVYGQLEHVDKDYLRTRKEQFGSKGGNLWKCGGGNASLKISSGTMGVDDNQHDYNYTLKTNTTSGFPAAKAQLQDFIRNLNTLSGTAFQEWVASVMDVDFFLKTYAVNVAVGMWDDYWNNANNYYLYFNSADESSYQVWFIPYDYDNTLGTCHGSCGLITDAVRQDPYTWGGTANPLVVKILQKPEWKALYKKYLQEICAGEMSFDNGTSRVKLWQSRIRSYVNNDTGQDTNIYDSPAYWGSHSEYRILEDGANNFFRVKAAVVNALE